MSEDTTKAAAETTESEEAVIMCSTKKYNLEEKRDSHKHLLFENAATVTVHASGSSKADVGCDKTTEIGKIPTSLQNICLSGNYEAELPEMKQYLITKDLSTAKESIQEKSNDTLAKVDYSLTEVSISPTVQDNLNKNIDANNHTSELDSYVTSNENVSTQLENNILHTKIATGATDPKTKTQNEHNNKLIKDDAKAFSERGNRNLAQPSSSNENTIKRIPISGVQKFLELMNILKIYPEKCKKWLSNQEALKEKLGDEYKPPVIYATVQQIAQNQIDSEKEDSKSNISKTGSPKVQNSLDLLNILYLNPYKCKKWLKNQETLRIKHGKLYVEPVIFSAVKEISLHHSAQSNEATKTVEPDCNIISPKISCNEIAVLDKEKVADSKTVINETPTKINSSKASPMDPHIPTVAINNAEDPGVYALFPPKLNTLQECIKLITTQKSILNIIGSKYRVPRFNSKGKKVFGTTETRNVFVRIPLHPKKIFKIEYPTILRDIDGLFWIEEHVRKISQFKGKYKPPIFNSEEYKCSWGAPEITSYEETDTNLPPVWNVPTFYDSAGYNAAPEIWPAPPFNNATYSAGYDVAPEIWPVPPFNTASPVWSNPMMGTSLPYDASTPFWPDPTGNPSQYFSSAYALPAVCNKSDFSQGTGEKMGVCMNPSSVSTTSTAMGYQKLEDSTITPCNREADIVAQLREKGIEKDFEILDPSFKSSVAFVFKGKSIQYLQNSTHLKKPEVRRQMVLAQLDCYRKKGSEYVPGICNCIPSHLLTIRQNSSVNDSLKTLIENNIKDSWSTCASVNQDTNTEKMEELVRYKKTGMCFNTKAMVAKDNMFKSYEQKSTYDEMEVADDEEIPILSMAKPSEDNSKYKSQKSSSSSVDLREEFSKHVKIPKCIAKAIKKIEVNLKLKKKKYKEKIIKQSDELVDITAKYVSHHQPHITGVPKSMVSEWFHTTDTKTTGYQPQATTQPRTVYSGQSTLQPAPPLHTPATTPLYSSQPALFPGGYMTPLFPATAPRMEPTPSPVPPPQTTPPVASSPEPPRALGKSKPSAFDRLGPVVAEPKKPRLTINLMFAKDEKKDVVREVVEEHVPVYQRQDVLASEDVIVNSYLNIWPWSKPVRVVQEASYQSRDLLLDQFEMIGSYKSKSSWIKVLVTGYPAHFKKEDVLDILMNSVAGMEMIPCFIEFKQAECMFLLNRSEQALTRLHKMGLVCKKGDIKLNLVVSLTNLTLDNLRFYKGAVFKTKLNKAFNAELNALDLSAFQMQQDTSHFLYFPLRTTYNQRFIMNVVKSILPSETITTLNLSGNGLTSIEAFLLLENTPSLKHLDLSNNSLPSVAALSCIRELRLHSLTLEGNPLCWNFIEQCDYLEVVRLLFPRLRVLDGVQIDSDVCIKRNFSVCPDAQEFVNSFLEIFFTLTDSDDRTEMLPLYSDEAIFTITCRSEMKRNPMYRGLKDAFYNWCRSLQDNINPLDPLEGALVGGAKIVKYFTKWPIVMHDPYSFTVDVILHTETTTVIKVTGLFKLPSESLNQDEPVAEFTRTFILASKDGVEYKITNDMMSISVASEERITSAFKIVAQRTLDLNLKFDSPPDDYLKKKFTDMVMALTKLDRNKSERCLVLKDWNLRKALQYFMKLEKLGLAADSL